MSTRVQLIAREAAALGFPLAGTAPVAPLERSAFCARWLADGRAGEMTWLAERMPARLDPHVRWPWARGLVVVGWPYRPPPPPPADLRAELRGRIAAYAFGIDYHEVMRGRLRTLGQKLGSRLGGTWRAYVDTGPILEREWAMRAGLGWIGKNTLVLHRAHGSWFLLGVLVGSVELPDVPVPADHCGSCTRCLEACPTGALTPYAMDPRRCISYLTIEHRTAIPLDLREGLGSWVFGCDVCQAVCPWNADAREPADAAWLTPSLPELLALDTAAWKARFRRTAVLRAGRAGLARNAAVALGNGGNPEAVPFLVRSLDGDPDPLVRGHAAWALGRLGGPTARAALEAAQRREADLEALAEIAAARAAADVRPGGAPRDP